MSWPRATRSSSATCFATCSITRSATRRSRTHRGGRRRTRQRVSSPSVSTTAAMPGPTARSAHSRSPPISRPHSPACRRRSWPVRRRAAGRGHGWADVGGSARSPRHRVRVQPAASGLIGRLLGHDDLVRDLVLLAQSLDLLGLPFAPPGCPAWRSRGELGLRQLARIRSSGRGWTLSARRPPVIYRARRDPRLPPGRSGVHLRPSEDQPTEALHVARLLDEFGVSPSPNPPWPAHGPGICSRKSNIWSVVARKMPRSGMVPLL